MEIHAYDELYVENAQNVVGHMFDFAISEAGIDGDVYASLFANSPCAAQMERGNPKFVSGKTGPELVRLILQQTGYPASLPEDVMYMDKSPEYWGGYILAYYQWFRDYRYAYILEAVPFSEFLKLYPTHHEMDIQKTVDVLDAKVRAHYPETALKRYRELAGLTQLELAQRSDVPLRQIQLFEQRRRDIRKTQADTLLKLSKALGCDMKMLLI